MPCDALRGTIRQCDEPEWTPLITVVGSELAPWFNWVFEIALTGGISVHAYKHITTRNYLFLDDECHAYLDNGDGDYSRRRLAVAIVDAFAGWERAAPSGTQIAALRSAVDHARIIGYGRPARLAEHPVGYPRT